MFYLYQVDIMLKWKKVYIYPYEQLHKYGKNMYEFEAFSFLYSAPCYELSRKILHKNDFGRVFVEKGDIVRVMLVSDKPLINRDVVIQTCSILSTAFKDASFSATQRNKSIKTALKTAINSVYGLTSDYVSK